MLASQFYLSHTYLFSEKSSDLSLITILITIKCRIIRYINKLLYLGCINPNSNSALTSTKKRSMKKFMTMILAVFPLGIFAQSSQEAYTNSDDIFYASISDVENTFTLKEKKGLDAATKDALAEDPVIDDMFKVDDLLFADPDFDIQDDMITYTKDQKTVFFSANRKIKMKKGQETDIKIKKSVQLQLFKASVKENGEWENLEMLPFNSKRYSNGHPALNQDDTKLYFVSDGPESTGKTDIFAVDLLEDGTYGKPENLGATINTEEREVFPFVDDSSVLYFASDHETEGKELNVFASKVVDNQPSTPIKLDVQANGSKDEYITAYKVAEVEAVKLAEKEAELRDFEVLLEAENIAEIERIEATYSEILGGSAYDFSTNIIVYTVQIGAFLQNVKTGTYTDSSGLFNHRYDDGFNRFYSGVFESSEKAMVH